MRITLGTELFGLLGVFLAVSAAALVQPELVHSIQPKNVEMFWKSFVKLPKSLMDGEVCAAKKFEITEEKPQEHYFASAQAWLSLT